MSRGGRFAGSVVEKEGGDEGWVLSGGEEVDGTEGTKGGRRISS